MANREEGAATPNWRQGQDQPQHQDAARQRHIHLNWSNFKPEFSGKPEDAEAHLSHSNDWMNAHHFDEDIKVQRFYLTLLGEARLWYTFSRIYLGKGTQNWAIHMNNYSMHGDHSHLMRTPKL